MLLNKPSADNQVKFDKICKFPGCSVKFRGIGPAKYCTEHQKAKHRKQINKVLLEKRAENEEPIEDANQKIKHDFITTQTLVQTCKLKGCENTFEIKIFPGTFTYPKYCPDHRNQYKRKLFSQNLTKDSKFLADN
jgi:hypothetical protein